MSDTSSVHAFDALLAIEDDMAMLEGLEPLIPATARTEGARRLVDLLTRTSLYLTTSGIAQLFEADDIAGEWLRIEGAWASVGAARAAELAGAIASLFPGGRVPRGEEDRYSQYQALMDDVQEGRPDDDPWRGVGIFVRLEFEYPDAAADVARGMRKLLEANRADPVAALVELAARADAWTPPARPTEWVEYLAVGRAGADSAAARSAHWASVMRDVPQSAEELREPAADERVLGFLDDISRLTVDDWSRVAGRRLAVTTERRAVELGFAVLRKGTRRAVSPEALERLRATGASEPAIRAAQITSALPRIRLVGTRRGPLWHIAIRAALQGIDAVLYHDDLMSTPEGRRTLRVLLQPFEGYAGVDTPAE